MVNPHEEKFTYKKLYGKIPDYAKHLRNFVEMGVLRSINTVKRYGRSINSVHIPRLCVKPYQQYIPHVKNAQATYINKP